MKKCFNVMKRPILCIVLIICITLSMAMTALGVASLSNFSQSRSYAEAFTDVMSSDWFYQSVRDVYEYEIMDGKSSDSFDPDGSLTLAEAIKLAATLHSSYYDEEPDFDEGFPWFAPYVEYALDNGIITEEYRDYNADATRSDFATIMYRALPEEAMTPINRILNGVIPDVYEHYSYGQAVYGLYRAGILTGSDEEGTFYPGRTLSRAEAATIIMRMINADARRSLSLANPLTAEEVYRTASPAVFYIEVFDDEGMLLKTGSGFFITDSGLAVTNYHVIIGGSDAKITMNNGDVHDVAGVCDYVWSNDLALIKIDVHNVPYLECADSSAIQTGATVYALGSPLGLEDTFSVGIVSQAVREIEGVVYIQLDAPISSGSSGGALLDSSARVIGVTSATAVGAQNINLAMPINLINDMNRDSYVPLSSIMTVTEYYSGYFPTPDFGAYFDVRLFNTDTSWGRTTYSYRLSDIEGDVDEVINTYVHLLEQNLFVHTNYVTDGGVEYRVFYNAYHDVMAVIGIDDVRSRECFSITVS